MGSRLIIGAAAMALALPSGAAAAELDAHGSVEQVYVTGLDGGARASLQNAAGRTVATKRANELGGLLFRKVKPGEGYRVRAAKGGATSEKLTVLTTKSAPPSEDVYDQEIQDNGYQYLTTRDGTKLAIYVHPPEDVSNALPTGYVPHVPAGPTPTLIEYSGYGYANPAGPQSGISILANLMGFTVVDVNMRGTGCSGGAFDFFEPLQNLDGYDIIETISRQPWVKFGKVGMMGISYGGISQLFTAQTRPPSLAAISPLSLIDQVQTTLYPGGILNTGFAFNWAKERAEEARPAGPEAGQEWAYKRIQEGDKTCEENQVMHGEAAKLINKVRANDTYRPKIADPLSPITFVDKINVPTFVACQWTDEQTGGHCPTLASRFTGTDKKWFTFTNGTHVDSLAPETFNRWYDFLMLYVARQAPSQNQAGIRAAAPVIYDAAMGVDGQTLPPDPIQEEPTYDGALAAFESLDPVRILFDNGAGGDPGKPNPGFEQSFPEFPIPDTTARSWFFANRGKLQDDPPGTAGADEFTWNARSTALTDFNGDTGAGENGLWTATPAYEWQPKPEGNALSYVTAPLGENTTVIGAGAVHAWVRSSKPTVDLMATITEVRPDGKETFVQNGWVRAKMRKLDKSKSTLLEPVLSLRARDLKPMPRGRFAKVVIPLYYQGHAYRADSQIRVTISDPNGDQPIWAFKETRPRGKKQANVAIAYSKTRPSRLILPVVPGVDVPTELPPCPGLRGQPCREYEAIENRDARR
jgi:predicted acyl esterase